MRSDGRFTAGSVEGEGLAPRKYRVSINAPSVDEDDEPTGAVIDPKYDDVATSGLEFDVVDGKENNFEIKVTTSGQR